MIRFGKKSIIWKWVISYICIILISAISNLVTYHRSQLIIKNRQEKINEVVLQQTSEKIYNCIVMMENLRKEILVNTNYSSLVKSSSSQHKSTTYKQYQLYTDLNSYLNLSNNYSHLILYFVDNDRIISDNSVNSSEYYWKIYNDVLGLNYAQWNTLINGDYKNFAAMNIISGDMEGIMFSRTIQTEAADRQKANLFVFFTKEDCRNILGEYKYNEDTSMLILDNTYKTAIKFDNASLFKDPAEEQLILEATRLGKNELTFRKNEIIRLDCLKIGPIGSLCILTPKSVFLETIRQFQMKFNLIFFANILFSLVLITMFVQYNYKPVRDLMKTLAHIDIPRMPSQKGQNLLKNENEFAIVKEGMVQVKNSYNNVSIALKRQNQLLQKVYLSRLLYGGAKVLPENELKEIYNICFNYTNFVVVLFYIEDFMDNSKPEEVGINYLDQAQLILVNVYDDLVTGIGYNAKHTKVYDILAVIISFPQNENNENLLNSIINRGKELVSNNYNLEFSAAVSNIHYELKQLPVAYQEALQALEAKKLYDLDDIVNYSEIAEKSGSSYNYPYELEQNLMRYIQLSNFNSAKSVFEKAVQCNINCDKFISHDIIRCLMFDLLGTVMKTFDGKKESQDFIRKLKPAKRLSECIDLESMNKVFEDILYKCCEYFGAGESKSEHEHLCFQIQEYIYRNCWDSNLTVASIAEHFSMSPVTMSKMFRETTGSKIPALLSEVRIQEAKNLLLFSNEPLCEIAEKVGFGSTKTFTRIFKHVEGCTPGQWRDMQRIVS